MSDLTLPSRVRGCLLGGAIGDALGAPVEFMSGAAIEAAYGTGGVRTFHSLRARQCELTPEICCGSRPKTVWNCCLTILRSLRFVLPKNSCATEIENPCR